MPKNRNFFSLGRYIFFWISIVFGYIYIYQVSIPSIEHRLKLLNLVLMGESKADYVYAMYFIAMVSNCLINLFGHSNEILSLIDFLGIIFLFQCAYHFLTKLFPNVFSTMSALLFITVTMPLFYRHHYYHPSDFYGVGIMFLILIAAKEQKYLLLASLCLISGVLWEKALLVPLFFLIQMIYLNGIRKGLLFSLPAIITTALYFITWRVLFPHLQRIHILTWKQLFYQSPTYFIRWGLWTAPIILIVVDILIHQKEFDWFWLLWLMYAPLLIIGLILMTHFWGEIRTFWILQPIFAGFIASWVDYRFSTDVQDN